MKDSKKYAGKIGKLYRAMKKEHGAVKSVDYDDPIDAVVFATLCEHMPLPSARTALRKIKRHFVDLNDLRVSRPEELVEVLASLVPARRGDTGGAVTKADGALDLVRLLSSGTAGAEGLHVALGEQSLVGLGDVTVFHARSPSRMWEDPLLRC